MSVLQMITKALYRVVLPEMCIVKYIFRSIYLCMRVCVCVSSGKTIHSPGGSTLWWLIGFPLCYLSSYNSQ